MSKMIIVEGNSNDKDNVRVIMVKGEKGDMGDLNHNDIVDNLTSDDNTKVLSAKQGKALKALIDANSEYIRTEIVENISYETTARTNADNTLQSNIDNETTARTNADTNLQNQISGLASGSPLSASSTSEMTDTTKIYVNTTDGYWYYYNGTTWERGGLYYSNDKVEDLINFIDKSFSHQDNLINPYEMVDNTVVSNSQQQITSNNSYFISDYLEIDTTKSYYSSVNAYNIGMFDENYDCLGVANLLKNIRVDSSLFLEGTKYIVISYRKTVIPFENRFNISFYESEFIDTSKNISYYNITSKNIAKHSINASQFNIKMVQPLTWLAIQNNINPFERDDFGLGTIGLNTGEYSWTDTNYNKRIINNYPIFVKKDTVIDFGDYLGIVWSYTLENLTPIERLTTTWSHQCTITEDCYINMNIRNSGDSVITDELREDMVNQLTFNYLQSSDTINSGTLINYNGYKYSMNNDNARYTRTSLQTSGQDSACYNNKVFQFLANGTFYVNDITDESNAVLSGPFYLDNYETIKPHANSVTFSNTFYSGTDLFPLIYIGEYNVNNKGCCYVHRIIYDSQENTYSTSLIQTIRIGFTNDPIWKSIENEPRDRGNFIVDYDNNYLYAYTLREGSSTRFFKFELPNINEETIILSKEDILDYFDTEFAPYIQGGCYYENKLFIVNGYNSQLSNSPALRIIDLKTKIQLINMNLTSLMSEPESIFIKNNTIYASERTIFKINFN